MRVVFVVLAFAFLVGCTEGGLPENHTTRTVTERSPEVADLSGPISLSLHIIARFEDGDSWTLDVSPDGRADLIIYSIQAATKRSFSVTEEQLSGLRAVLIRERFFELEDEYGLPSKAGRKLSVRCGELNKTVVLLSLSDLVRYDRDKSHEAARAVRVWMHVRSWFDDAEAVNLGRYDQEFLDTVARL